MTAKKTVLISLFLLTAFVGPILAQEQPLKDYAEDRKENKFCFYPSTLRMVNLANNPDFNDMVSGIEKLLIYNLDSTAKADKDYKAVLTAYQDLGFEEYASAYGGDLNFYIYGKEAGKSTEYIGVLKRDDMLAAFYMRGQLSVSALPRLMQSMGEGEFINPFDFNLDDFGKNTQNK